jgi:predicted nucleotidyltransferase component of viral defense system
MRAASGHCVIQASLEVDLNFLTRVPLWEPTGQSFISLGSYQVKNFPVLDKHELAGGKLKALFSRHSSRDLFDTYYILQDQILEMEKLRHCLCCLRRHESFGLAKYQGGRHSLRMD